MLPQYNKHKHLLGVVMLLNSYICESLSLTLSKHTQKKVWYRINDIEISPLDTSPLTLRENTTDVLNGSPVRYLCHVYSVQYVHVTHIIAEAVVT